MYAHIEREQLIELSDGDLVRRLKLGNEQALTVLLQRHSDSLFRFCCHLASRQEDAEDICQETLTRAITRVETLQAGGAFRSWLFSIARNLAIDSYRVQRRICSFPDEENAPILLYDDNPQDQIEVVEEHATVAEALGKLAQSHQQVLMLREVEQLSYAEIATKLDVSQSAVETLLFRARRRLKEEYSKSDALPGLAFLGALRGFAARFAPISGVPLAKGALLTAALVGGAAVATHQTPLSSHDSVARVAVGPQQSHQAAIPGSNSRVAPLPVRRVGTAHPITAMLIQHHTAAVQHSRTLHHAGVVHERPVIASHRLHAHVRVGSPLITGHRSVMHRLAFNRKASVSATPRRSNARAARLTLRVASSHRPAGQTVRRSVSSPRYRSRLTGTGQTSTGPREMQGFRATTRVVGTSPYTGSVNRQSARTQPSSGSRRHLSVARRSPHVSATSASTAPSVHRSTPHTMHAERPALQTHVRASRTVSASTVPSAQPAVSSTVKSAQRHADTGNSSSHGSGNGSPASTNTGTPTSSSTGNASTPGAQTSVSGAAPPVASGPVAGTTSDKAQHGSGKHP